MFIFPTKRLFSLVTSFLPKPSSMQVIAPVPGHGPLCDKEEIRTYLEFFDTTSSIMKKLVKEGASEKQVLRYNKFPAFYPEYREGIKKLALVNWYRFYKKKERKTRKQ